MAIERTQSHAKSALFAKVTLLAVFVWLDGAREMQAQTTHHWKGGNGTWDVAENWDPAGAPGPGDTAVIDSGTVEVASDVETAEVEHSDGTLSGAGELEVSDSYTWSGGTMGGGGILTIPETATLTLTGNIKNLRARTIDHAGTAI